MVFWCAGVDSLHDPTGAFGVVAVAEVGAAASRVAALDPGEEIVRFRPARGMAEEIRPHAAVGFDELADEFRPGDGLLEFTRGAGSAGDEAFDLKLVGIDQKADERLLVVRIAADIGEHEQAGAFGGVHRYEPGEHTQGGERGAEETVAGQTSTIRSPAVSLRPVPPAVFPP